MNIRFGRAITNPSNGTRHTPLEVKVRFHRPAQPFKSGTYGLKDSHLNSSDESSDEDRSIKTRDDTVNCAGLSAISKDRPPEGLSDPPVFNTHMPPTASVKDVSVVTTITSQTQFTESLNRLPESLAKTIQVSFKLKPLHTSSLGRTITESNVSNRLPIVHTYFCQSPKMKRVHKSSGEQGAPRNRAALGGNSTSRDPQAPPVAVADACIAKTMRYRYRAIYRIVSHRFIVVTSQI
ncbi:hypothetical protein PGTUg99_027037 [Puccinia graminis f. sp. tritici]|uniref:Uncharacterized protein n=1 Tax=Puccinia graminis f. sp. tritici TaxID=56615 RepID=A0A5B0NHQ4_PUCGR|nr:hypothetical protein PGTUg99_027037 [Puccinia graminis f. sp. tritici]